MRSCPHAAISMVGQTEHCLYFQHIKVAVTLGEIFLNNLDNWSTLIFAFRMLTINQWVGVRKRGLFIQLKRLLGQRKVTDFMLLLLEFSIPSMCTCCVFLQTCIYLSTYLQTPACPFRPLTVQTTWSPAGISGGKKRDSSVLTNMWEFYGSRM